MEPVVQWVRTSWTKRSRGGDAAARRNAVPFAFHLPAAGAPLIHQVFMHEHEGFRPHGETRAELPAADQVELRQVGERLRVQLVPDASMMPRRNRRPPVIYLRRGEWVRWQINYRSSGTCPCGHEWSYRLDTLSLAHGEIATDAFLAQPPYAVDERAYLR
ncbi:hypothetical protein [Phytohabitans aurantiacus]|uniref:Uncharacterized protein n=1 Tax=Phytohabitans aurantiacus TaxID=3016789 RepID=A0ABQ5QZL2_9ACTN|nr:hypothetical protein [Phytohabitans aurantiacus]GLH99998.1 hypothetical protein Pa4123_52740 [Phytohabitans aurantiacus]